MELPCKCPNCGATFAPGDKYSHDVKVIRYNCLSIEDLKAVITCPRCKHQSEFVYADLWEAMFPKWKNPAYGLVTIKETAKSLEKMNRAFDSIR